MDKLKIRIVSGEESLVGETFTLYPYLGWYKIEESGLELMDTDYDIQFAYSEGYIGVEVECKGIFVMEDNLKFIDSFILLK
jgi:hypothetical protein